MKEQQGRNAKATWWLTDSGRLIDRGRGQKRTKNLSKSSAVDSVSVKIKKEQEDKAAQKKGEENKQPKKKNGDEARAKERKTKNY